MRLWRIQRTCRPLCQHGLLLGHGFHRHATHCLQTLKLVPMDKWRAKWRQELLK
uniref:Uncharacterized protein n=1 Tax=Populus trichocarpa TaxID=3694 RepID=A9PDR4_POPTR|nr:unknown [Populus trichocarpa]